MSLQPLIVHRPRRTYAAPLLVFVLGCADAANPAREAIDRAERAQPPVAPASEEASWYCPMHPEVLQNTPGTCPKCSMNLLKRG